MNIAEYRARAAVSHMMVAKLAEDYDNHRLTVEQSSMCKILTTEIMLDGCRLLLEVIGQAAYVSQGSPYENLSRRLVQNASGWVRKTFGGGANDMLRAVVAERGMGMARQ